MDGVLAFGGGEVVARQDVGDQGLDLDVGEVLADADAGAAAERDQRIRRLLVLFAWRGEAVGIEAVGVVEDGGQAVAGGEGQAYLRARRYGDSRRTRHLR